jgi:hypothetical protein
MAVEVPTVPAPPPPPALNRASESPDFEQRWAAWQAKGAAHERAARRKLAIGVPILVSVAAALMYVLFGR